MSISLMGIFLFTAIATMEEQLLTAKANAKESAITNTNAKTIAITNCNEILPNATVEEQLQMQMQI